jgi:uncharacterized membrane protein
METIKCAQCGQLNAAASETCARCGAELSGVFGSTFSDAQSDAWTHRGQGNWSETVEDEPALSPQVGPFTSIGAVITPTIEVFKNNIWLITKIVVVVFAPYEILKVMENHASAGRPDWQPVVGFTFLGLVCSALASPALIYALVTVMRTGQAPSVSEAYRWGLGRLGRIMVCAVLAWVLQFLGLICLVIPGIILGLAFEIVYPMAALENRSPVETLKRSYHMTKGYWGRIFGASFAVGLMCWVIALPAGLLTGILIMGGINFWPLNSAVALVADVAYQLPTVLSLIIYLSLVTHAPQDVIIEGGTATSTV